MIRHLGSILLMSATASAVASPSPPPSSAGATTRPAMRQRLLDQEPRLQKRVTLRLRRRPLSEVVAELSRQTEVAMRASADTADEPAVVVVTEQPAREVMHQIATLFGYRWTRIEKVSGAIYELYQDLRSKQEEAALRGGRHAGALQAVQAALRRQMQESAEPIRRALLHVAAGLTTEQWQALAEGESLHFSSATEPLATPLPATIARALGAARPASLPGGAASPFVNQEDEAAFRQEERRSQDAWTRARGFCVTVQLDVTHSDGRAGATLLVTPTALTPGHDTPTVVPSLVLFGQGESEKISPPARKLARGAEITRRAAEEGQEFSPANLRELGANADDDRAFIRENSRRLAGENSVPSLRTSASLCASSESGGDNLSASPSTGTLDENLVSIAERFGVNVIADAYRTERFEQRSLVFGGGRSLKAVVAERVAPLSTWERDGAFVRSRRHGWYHLRRREIPERLVREWGAALRKAERLSVPDAARLALALRDEQLARFAAVMEEAGVFVSVPFGEEGTSGTRLRSVLRAYGSLSPAHRRLIETGRRVSAAAMPPTARRWLCSAIGGGAHEARAEAAGTTLGEGLSLSVVACSDDGAVAAVTFQYVDATGGVTTFELPVSQVR